MKRKIEWRLVIDTKWFSHWYFTSKKEAIKKAKYMRDRMVECFCQQVYW